MWFQKLDFAWNVSCFSTKSSEKSSQLFENFWKNHKKLHTSITDSIWAVTRGDKMNETNI